MSGIAEFFIIAAVGLVSVLVEVGADRVQQHNQRIADDFEREQRLKRQRIRENEIDEQVSSFRNDIFELVKEQSSISLETSNNMLADIEEYQSKLTQAITAGDIFEEKNIHTAIENSSRQLMKHLKDKERKYTAQYKDKIDSTVKKMNKDAALFFETKTNEINAFKSDIEKKRELSRNLAITYYEDAKSVVNSITEQYDSEFVSKEKINQYNNNLSKAFSMIENEKFETAIVICQQVFSEVKTELLNIDELTAEHENWLKNSLIIVGELKSYMEERFTISQEIANEVEKKLGSDMEFDIVGYDLRQFAGTIANGTVSRYDELKQKIDKCYDTLVKDGFKLSKDELIQICAVAASTWKKEAISTYIRALNSFDNALMRQRHSDLIIDQFEEQNFEYTGYMYADDDGEINADIDEEEKNLYLRFENDDEEIIVILEPKEEKNGSFSTKAEVHLLKGDPHNEARLNMLQNCVANIASDGKGESVKGGCVSSTRGELSGIGWSSQQISKAETRRTEV